MEITSKAITDMQQVELCCIDMRTLCEKTRPKIPSFRFGYANYHRKEIYGEVTVLDNGWLDIRMNALLPHCKLVGGTQYIMSVANNTHYPLSCKDLERCMDKSMKKNKLNCDKKKLVKSLIKGTDIPPSCESAEINKNNINE